MPKDSAYFQLPGVLFISGGVLKDRPCADLMGALLDGSCMSYDAMKYKRKQHSLTGDASHLFASAGTGDSNLQLESCEMFTLSYNKWESLASCNQGRSHHGSCFV